MARITDLSRIHKLEVFEMLGEREYSLAEVQPVLEAMGFVFEDDFASLARTDRVEQWQTEMLVHCGFLAQGREVYPDESGFDTLRFEVLPAFLPREQIERALHVICDVSEQIRLTVSHGSLVVSRGEIRAVADGWAEDILGETGDICGSETAAILISMEYDRRKT